MKKFLIFAVVILSMVEMYRTGSATAFVLSLVIAYQNYGMEIYKTWCRTFNK